MDFQSSSKTHFAPAERADLGEIRRLAAVCLENPVSQALLEAVSGHVLILNEARQVLAANASVLEALGLSCCDRICGLRPGEVFGCVHVSDGPGGCGTAEACAQCGAALSILGSQTEGAGVTGECLLTLRGDQGARAGEFQVKATPIQLGGEALTVFVLQDISGQKRSEALERLIFQDLEGLVGSLDAQIQRLVQNPEQAQLTAGQIQDLTTQLAQEILAHRILMSAEKGALRVEFQQVPVATVLQDLQSLMLAQPFAEGRQILVDAEPSARIETEPVLLRRALANLLRNALEAVPRGETVHLRHQQMGQVHRFEVQNPGVLSEPVALRVFQRSFSTKAAKGRGMGTYGTRLFVEGYLGGKVGFRSDLDHGTVFWVELPTRMGDGLPRESASKADAEAPLVKPEATGTSTVLVVDDSRTVRNLLASILGKEHRVLLAADGEEGIRLALEHGPDLILLDVIMPGIDGYAVCARLKSDPRTEEIPVLFLSGLSSGEDETLALEAGAIDFITKPFRPVPVAARVRNHLELKRNRDRLRDLSLLDGLTGIANRRRFDRLLEAEWQRARRNGLPLSVILGDVDFFKRYNDGYGHAQGDECLKVVARAFQEGLMRPGDLAARYGGEEFVCVLPETDPEGARDVAERIRARLKAEQLPHDFSAAGPVVSLSLGVATLLPAQVSEGVAQLMKVADERLYQAKETGRDRVVG